MTAAVIDETQAQPVEAPEAPKPQAKTPKATQKETKGASAPAQTPDAPVPGSDSRYAADEVQGRLAAGVKAARAAGFSRTKLQELTELTPAQLWRIEDGRAHRHEVAQVEAVLARVTSGELKPPTKPGKVNQRDAQLREFVASVTEKSTKAELLDVLKRVADALDAA